MRYKTSCFNPTLLKQNLLRFWPLMVGITLYYLLSVVMPFWEISRWAPDGQGMFHDIVASSIYTDAQLASFMMVFFAGISAALSFRHIHARKDTQFYLGLPLTRKCLYLTNLISGYLMLAIPVIFSVLILGITTMVWGFGFMSLPMLGCILSAATIFYALAVLACVLGGQTFGAFLIYVGLNIALYLLTASVGGILEWLLPGWSGGNPFYAIVQKLTPAAQYLEMGLLPSTDAGVYQYQEGWIQPVYAIAGIAIMALSCWLYQLRKSESAGDMVSFQPIKLICKVFVALIAGTLLTLLVMNSVSLQQDITLPTILIPLVLFTVVGWVAAEMVIRKSFRVVDRKECLGCGILLLGVLAMGLCLNSGGFGYVSRMPDPAEVDAAVVNGIEVKPEEALELHSYILSHPEELTNGTGNHAWSLLPINYELENGTVFTRRYCIRHNSSIYDFMGDLMQKPDYVFQSWLGDLDGERPNAGSLYFYDIYDEVTEQLTPYFTKEDQPIRANVSISSEDAELLYDAVCRDIEDGTLPPRAYSEWGINAPESIAEISFERLETAPSISKGSETAAYLCAFISIFPEMHHTIEALGAMDYQYIGE